MLAALALAGCGGGSGKGDDRRDGDRRRARSPATAARPAASCRPGAVGPADTAEEADGGPGRHRGEPGGAAEGPEPRGELSGEDRSAVTRP